MSYTTYLLNLDRNPDRLAKLTNQLSAQSVKWERFVAIDGSAMAPQDLDKMVSRDGPIPRMPVGAQACTASHMQILQAFLLTDHTHAVVLEDDAVLAPDFAQGVEALMTSGVTGLININRQTPSGEKKRLIVRMDIRIEFGSYKIYDLKGVNYGCAGYVIDRKSATQILNDYPHPNMPIDHIMFNPNVSTLFSKMPISQMFPALVKPDISMTSSIQTVAVAGANKMKNRIKRLRAEVSIVPRLLVGIALMHYQVRVLEFGCNDVR